MAQYFMAPPSNPPSGWSAGSDANSGLSRSTPKATLSGSFTVMHASDTLTIANGTYTGDNNTIRSGSGIHTPPSGIAGAHTVVTAENPGQVILSGISGQTMLDVNAFYGPSVALSYVTISGLQFVNSSGGGGIPNIGGIADNNRNTHHIYLKRCGFQNMLWLFYSHHMLVEDCYVTGRGRYNYEIFTCNDVVLRRCVGRLDNGNGGGEPISNFVNYTSQNVEFQNCIAIDSDNSFYANYEGVYGGIYIRAENTISQTWISGPTGVRGCMVLNVKHSASTGPSPAESLAIGRSSAQNTFINNIWWDLRAGMVQDNGFSGVAGWTSNHCTWGRTTVAGGFGSNMNQGTTAIGAFSNSIYYSIAGTAINGALSSNTNAFFANGTNKTSVTSSSGDITATNPLAGGGLTYLPRIESAGSFHGAANDGGDIGATVLYQYGVSGTFYGDSGYNTLTTTALWPWPDESIIKTFFINFGTGAGSPANVRGFCSGNSLDGTSQTLTKYVWEYLGSQIPASIYNPTGGGGAVISTDVVTLSYTQPLTNPVRDIGTNKAASFFNLPVQNITPPTPPPPEPTAPVLSSVSAPDSQSLTWNNTNVTSENGYDYESAPASSGPWTLRGTRPADTVTFTWTGATASTTYFMRVSSFGASGTRYPSNVLSVATPAGTPTPPPEPTAPVLNSVSAPAPTTLVWNNSNVSNELGYEYETAFALAGPFTVQGTGPVDSVTFTWPSATQATLYYLRVSSFGAAGTRYHSNVLSVTTPAADASSFVSQSVPSTSMTTSATQTVGVTMKNTGAATWDAATGYHLYSQNAPGNTTWGLSQVPVPGTVLPNGNAAFSFLITAPSTAATYNFQWRMRHGTTEFGAQSTNQAIVVSNPTQFGAFYVSTTGSDTNSGTITAPFRTLAKAFSVVQPSGSVQIRGGTYLEAVVNNCPGGTSWTNSVTVQAYQNEPVILRPNTGTNFVLWLQGAIKQYIQFRDLVLDAVNVNYNVVKLDRPTTGTDTANHIRLYNCELKNSKFQALLTNFASDGNEFQKLSIHSNGKTLDTDGLYGYAMYIKGSSNIIEDCDIYDQGSSGIQIFSTTGASEPPNFNTIRRCKIHNNCVLSAAQGRGAGVTIASGSQNLVYNNLIYVNFRGISCSNTFTNKMYNNTIVSNPDIGLYLENGGNHQARNNICYLNGSNFIDTSGSSNTTPNFIGTNPNFVTGTTSAYYLGNPSGAANTGATLTEFSNDYDLNPRPFGSAWDQGAYERQS
jgi:Right handed beta helix region/Protein of unknown function (DUF1565)